MQRLTRRSWYIAGNRTLRPLGLEIVRHSGRIRPASSAKPEASAPRLLSTLNRALRPLRVEVVRRQDSTWRPLAYLGEQPVPVEHPVRRSSAPYLRVFADDGSDDDSFDFSVVMPTILRPTIAQALHSIFRQDLPGRVQTLIGVDLPVGDFDLVEAACRERPPNHVVVLFYPGYSTSVRNGGLHPAWDGGVLRTVLTYLARSRRVAYLDDDNWWAPHHLSSMAAALEGHDWAWSRRWFVHPLSRAPICEDQWESVGPDRTGTSRWVGGWVDPNCLAIDKLECEAVLRWWSIPICNNERADSDRNVFRILRERFSGCGTDSVSVYYKIDESDTEHSNRVAAMGEERYRNAGLRHPENRDELSLASTEALGPHHSQRQDETGGGLSDA